MSAFVKTKLKAARDALGKKDYTSAKDLATTVLEYEPDNYNAYVYLPSPDQTSSSYPADIMQ